MFTTNKIKSKKILKENIFQYQPIWVSESDYFMI